MEASSISIVTELNQNNVTIYFYYLNKIQVSKFLMQVDTNFDPRLGA